MLGNPSTEHLKNHYRLNPPTKAKRMDSILNVDVSCVPNYYTKNTQRNVTLLRWLTSAKYAAAIEKIRATTDKATRNKLKAQLPAITPSGQFTRIDEDNMIAYSGFIQFDIDLQDNPHITNYADLKQEIAKIKNIAYCGLSASGMGYWGLLRIAYPEKHLQHWQYLHATMQRFGIYIDGAPKSICSLRGYSYDADAYFNHRAEKLYHYLMSPQQSARIAAASRNGDWIKTNQLLQKLEAKQIDITTPYKNWFAIGCALAGTFGEDGRRLFHRFSCMHMRYNPRDCDIKYTQCLQHATSSGIGVIVNLCKGVGV